MVIYWRRGRDSNPRDGIPPTHFPGVRLQPLGHLSDRAFGAGLHYTEPRRGCKTLCRFMTRILLGLHNLLP